MSRYEGLARRLDDVGSLREAVPVPARPPHYALLLLARDGMYAGTAGIVAGSVAGNTAVSLGAVTLAAVALGLSGYAVLNDAQGI